MSAARPLLAALALLLACIALSAPALARELKEEGRQLTELPSSIKCPASLLLSAEVANPAFACSPAYYNCLGVPVGGSGPLSYCQDGLVFDKSFPYSESSPVPATQGGACNYWTPACGGGHPSGPYPGQSGHPDVYPGQSGHPDVVYPGQSGHPDVVYPGQSGHPVNPPATSCAIANYACVDHLRFCLGGYAMLCAPGTVCGVPPVAGQSPCIFP